MSAPPHTRVGVLGGSMADQALISDLDIYRTAKFLIDRHGVEVSTMYSGIPKMTASMIPPHFRS